MRKMMSLVAAGVLAAGMLAVRAGSQTKANSGFDQLKTLVGTWEATTSEGKNVSTIRLVSDGTAIQETDQSEGGKHHNQMITMYTPDRDRVAMTHYCSAGNQPRMETAAVSANQKEFDFEFTGIGNADAKDPHMHHMTLKIQDADHISETWTFLANGQEQKYTFNLVRTKE